MGSDRDLYSGEKAEAAEMYSETEIREHYRALTEFLIAKKLTITTMESATAGQIASLITDTEGSSAVLKGAFVTYSNEAKIMQGVPADVIARYTVYSRETAEAMALACQKAYGADIGIGVTGTMGNVDPGNPAASVPGQVYFAIAAKGSVESYHIALAPQPSRLMYKLAVAEEVYRKLRKAVEDEG
ncbi:MAG: CinA family protein [Lachnospiraceae bacterium]|nr:CinA family protein [Lachnospiraceae bacterium]